MTERELVEAVVSGDHAAFAELYRAHVGSVVAVVRDNVRDREGVADVVQDVFLRALDQLPTLRQTDRFRPWLLAIARHTAVDRRRAAGRERQRSDADPRAEDRPSPAPEPDDVAALREMSELVKGCVAGLSRRDATALAMVGHLGFTPAEIADSLGVSVGAAKVIVHRARRRLTAALALELVVRRRLGACPVFEEMRSTDPVAASRHVVSCSACSRAVHDEVHGYGVAGGDRVGLLSPPGQRSSAPPAGLP